MAEDNKTFNALVFGYLKSVSSKLAKGFKKEIGAEGIAELPPESPTLPFLVKEYNESINAKRKLDDDLKQNGPSKKKAKLNGHAVKEESEDSDEDSDSADEEVEPVKKTPAKITPNKKPGICL